MKRDDDLLRDLLFRLEAEDDHLSMKFGSTLDSSKEDRREEGHLLLLVDAGLVAQTGRYSDVYRITNAGHDFIAAIRSDTIWKTTKEIAESAGAKTISVLFEVALGLGKQKIKEATGIEI